MTSPTLTNPSLNESFYASLQTPPNGERVRTCLQCGMCSGVCPLGYAMDYPPGKMIAALRSEIFDRVLNSDTVWMCVACYACTEVCPSGIPLTEKMMARAICEKDTRVGYVMMRKVAEAAMERLHFTRVQLAAARA